MPAVRDFVAWGMIAAVAVVTGCAPGDEPSRAPASSTSAASASASPRPDVTILALGDSTVWDHDCTDCTHSYPHKLREALARSTGKEVRLIDATQQNKLTSALLLRELDSDAWFGATHDPAAPSPRAAIAEADIVTITLGANDAPWQQDDDPVCRGDWGTRSCLDRLVEPSLGALGTILDTIHRLRADEPTAIRVTTFYNELIPGPTYVPNRPREWVAKGLTDAKVFSDALNTGICERPRPTTPSASTSTTR